MPQTKMLSKVTIGRDITAGLVVFLVALPLCLGVAQASNAAPFAGILAGIIGGLLVGSISGSHTSVSGPAAGLTAVVATQIAVLGSFEAFLLAVALGGVLQIVLGAARAGGISAFVPSSVIKGLLAAIGVILVLKQIPHVFGHDTDPEGDMSFRQPDHENTFSEIVQLIGDVHVGAAAIGLASIGLLIIWERSLWLKKTQIPGSFAVVVGGVTAGMMFRRLGGDWAIESTHMVQVPVAESLTGIGSLLRHADFNQWSNPAVYGAALTIAIVASLETLLNLEAVDKLDRRQRQSPPNRELVAQGVGNVVAGLVGGIPVTSVIVRSSVNINSGGCSKLATIIHGGLLLGTVVLIPNVLNRIPLSCLAAILLVTGIKLASPKLVRQMWDAGRYQFIPFIVTVVAIVFTDLLIGILIGLAVGLTFILNSNLRKPIRRVMEKHLGGDVLRVVLPEQVSFLNRASLERILHDVPRGGHVLLDAQNTHYVDPDVLSLIREFKNQTGPPRGIRVSLNGFREKYQLRDEIQFIDYSTREIQGALTAQTALKILQEGNERFRTGRQLTRNLLHQVHATAEGQHPVAVVLSCIDSRTPAEIVFDLGLGDIFTVRVAGNVISPEVLGSMEYAVEVAGAKLVLVLGHTRCGAVTAAVTNACNPPEPKLGSSCEHLAPILTDIQKSVTSSTCETLNAVTEAERPRIVDDVARDNVRVTVHAIMKHSGTIRRLVEQREIAIVGMMYDVTTGDILIVPDAVIGLDTAGDQSQRSG